MDGSQALDPRKTIFVGGVPRPLRAIELAMIMDRLYGGVCYAGIDVDPELKYPKGKPNIFNKIRKGERLLNPFLSTISRFWRKLILKLQG